MQYLAPPVYFNGCARCGEHGTIEALRGGVIRVQQELIGQLPSHEEAARVAHDLEALFPQQVSLSTSTPHEHWWQHSPWLEKALAAVGGTASAASQLVPGFGVLFMGGPLAGIRQGDVIAQWLEAHPSEQSVDAHFVIVSVVPEQVSLARQAMVDAGALHVHEADV